jgi:hypothetical protein
MWVLLEEQKHLTQQEKTENSNCFNYLDGLPSAGTTRTHHMIIEPAANKTQVPVYSEVTPCPLCGSMSATTYIHMIYT